MKNRNEKWLYEISSKHHLFKFNFKEVWRYKDLLFLFIKRDVVTVYKQTILGPLWYLIQPLFTSVIFTLVFNTIAKIETGSIHPFLFNLAGITCWNYFKNCLNGTADTFKKNQGIFGKVYFPRIIMPISVVFSNLIKFGIQLLILVGFYLYFLNTNQAQLPTVYIVLFPIIVLIMGILSLGLGMIISSLVTKYRDVSFLLGFGVNLLMYISLVNLPYSLFVDNGYKWLIDINPMAQLINTSRFLLLGSGNFNTSALLYPFCISLIVLFIGLLVFNRTERNFIDTV